MSNYPRQSKGWYHTGFDSFDNPEIAYYDGKGVFPGPGFGSGPFPSWEKAKADFITELEEAKAHHFLLRSNVRALEPPVKDNACPRCGTLMRKRTGKLKGLIHGEAIEVAGVVHLLCPKCKEVLLSLDESKKLRQSAERIYRTRKKP